MTNPNRKNKEPRHLAQRYTLRRRVQSAKFTRAGDRHVAHAEEDAPAVAASDNPPDDGDLPVAVTTEGHAGKETTP